MTFFSEIENIDILWKCKLTLKFIFVFFMLKYHFSTIVRIANFPIPVAKLMFHFCSDCILDKMCLFFITAELSG